MTRTALLLVRDLLHLVVLTCTSHTSLAAENLFLRKQLAFYVERNIRPRRLDNAARVALVVLARVIDWRQLLTVVQPETLVRWHRQGFRLFWRWKSRRPGRPRIYRPVSLCTVSLTGELTMRPRLIRMFRRPTHDSNDRRRALSFQGF
jgi:putative transposase